MIQPLHGGVSEIHFLMSLLNAPAEGEAPAAMPGLPVPDAPALAEVKKTFAQVAGGADWRTAVRDGFAKGSAFKPAGAVKVDPSAVAAAFSGAPNIDVPVQLQSGDSFTCIVSIRSRRSAPATFELHPMGVVGSRASNLRFVIVSPVQ